MLYADSIGSSLYEGKQGLIEFNHAVMGFKEWGYDQIPQTGLSAEFGIWTSMLGRVKESGSGRVPPGARQVCFHLANNPRCGLPTSAEMETRFAG